VQVHCDEGVATYIGPEPCVDVREDGDEASVGEGIGQPLSRESQSPGADAVSSAEGNTNRRAIASAPGRPGVVEEPGMCRRSLRGNREISRSTVRQPPPVRIGKARSRSR
jgi:hypothetical protein